MTSAGSETAAAPIQVRRRPLGGLGRWLIGAGVAVVVAYPLLMVLASVSLPAAFHARPLTMEELLGGRVPLAWRNTLVLGVWVTLLSILFAYPAALLAWRSRAARWIDLIMSVPFLTPPFLVSLAWTQTVGRRGYASRLGLDGVVLGEALFTLAGMAVLMAVNYAPLVYFALRAQFARLPTSWLWAARVSGGGWWQALRTVVLPLSVPPLLAGGFLAFASAIGEYGTPLVVGQRIGYPVVATEIARRVSVAPIHLSLASALGASLLVAGISAYGLSRLLQRRGGQLAGGGRGGASYPPPPLLPAPVKVMASLVVGFFAVVGVVVPFGAIVTTSLLRLISPGPRWDNLSLTHLQQLLTPGAQGFQALLTSLLLALAAACLALLLGTAAARAGGWVTLLATVPVAVPAIVMAVGFLRGWNAPWAAAFPMYGTGAILVGYYLAQYLPYTVQYVQAGSRALPASLEWAARVHGANTTTSFWTVALPLLWPHALGGAIMVFSISFRELVGSVLLRPPSLHTTATYVLSQFDQGSISAGMSMGLVALLASLISVITARHFAAQS